MKKQRNVKCTLAWLTAIAVSFVMLFSVFYVAKHAEHKTHCHEQNCPICATIDQCINNVKQIGTALAITVAICAIIKVISTQREGFELTVCNMSLISQKVRLND
ncbi:MAG: hypothetical protein E7282_06560 [Lachnospiraceae bacterium]|nr:hypothetical protein [Lachnospiraceae bacterium]